MDRPNLGIVGMLYQGKHHQKGIVFNWGEDYKEIRRFTLRTLRDLGFGKRSSEGMILEECDNIVRSIKMMIENSEDGLIDLDKLLNKAALNIVWNITAAQRFDYDEERMKKLYNFIDVFMMLGLKVVGKPLGIFPWLRFVPPFRSTYNEVYNGMEKCRAFIRETIKYHKETFDEDNPRDFIDKFLIASKEDPRLFNEDQLLICCLDLFIGGSETTSKSLMFALLMVIKSPGIQDKVRKEIDEVTQGKDFVTVEDRDHLHFTEAVINEVWRYCTIIGAPPFRNISAPMKIKDFNIPKDTVYIYNIYSVHKDQAYWKDPEVFRPERFIVDQKFKADERNIPFGIGKRRCIGESLARMENFLIFANLIKHFKFAAEDGAVLDTRPLPGLTNGPQPFKMKIIAI